MYDVMSGTLGPDRFLIPAMFLITFVLTLIRRKEESL